MLRVIDSLAIGSVTIFEPLAAKSHDPLCKGVGSLGLLMFRGVSVSV